MAIVPSEGTGPQINTINLVARAANAGVAEVFINYAISAQAQQAFAEALRVIWRVTLPLALRGIVTGAVIAFLGHLCRWLNGRVAAGVAGVGSR